MTSGGPARSASGIVGIGTDLVSIDRFAAVVERRPGLMERLFTAEEAGRLAARSSPRARAASSAARFAAKEAIMKSLGVGLGGARFTDIEVTGGSGVAPGVSLTGRARSLAVEQGIDEISLSMTHDAGLAVATAVAYRRCSCAAS
jgi:holo-[acyl-carrier protein] synthase